jgi:hypothetical protein
MKRDNLSDTDYERLADLAEQGFDPSAFRVRRRGRPSLSSTGISPRIATRVSAQVHDLAMTRAASEGRTMSQVLRKMVEDYAKGTDSERGRDRPSPAGGARPGAES